MPTETMPAAMPSRTRLIIVVCCAVLFLIGATSTVLDTLPPSVSLFMKLAAVSVAFLLGPWLVPEPWRYLKTSPVNTMRYVRLAFIAFLGLITGLLGLAVFTVFGINCRPNETEITAMILWGFFLLAGLLVGPPILRRASQHYRRQAHDTGTCYECGYELHHSASASCPECGYTYLTHESGNPPPQDPPTDPAVN